MPSGYEALGLQATPNVGKKKGGKRCPDLPGRMGVQKDPRQEPKGKECRKEDAGKKIGHVKIEGSTL